MKAVLKWAGRRARRAVLRVSYPMAWLLGAALSPLAALSTPATLKAAVYALCAILGAVGGWAAAENVVDYAQAGRPTPFPDWFIIAGRAIGVWLTAYLAIIFAQKFVIPRLSRNWRESPADSRARRKTSGRRRL